MFYIKSHLGNNRIVADASGRMIQRTDYYPFGMPTMLSSEEGVQPYKYGGKEYDTMNGLNLYDFHARQYDPAISRFTSIDPLAEKKPWLTPYHYCSNNPINRIDPNGKEDIVDVFHEPQGSVMHLAPLLYASPKGDGKFTLFGHGNYIGIQYPDSKGDIQMATTPEAVRKLISENNPDFEDAMKNGKEISLTIYSCNAASEKSEMTGKKVTPIAERFSKKYPNVTVTAANGQVVYGKDKEGKPLIKGVMKSGEKGKFVTYKKGKKIAEKGANYISPDKTIYTPKKMIDNENAKPKLQDDKK